MFVGAQQQGEVVEKSSPDLVDRFRPTDDPSPPSNISSRACAPRLITSILAPLELGNRL